MPKEYITDDGEVQMDYDLLARLYNVQSFVGYTDDEIFELSKGYDAIPSALVDIWKFCRKTPGLFENNQDSWIDLNFRRKYTWVDNDTNEYFYLLNENQGVYQAAIRKEDLKDNNPIVYVVEDTQDNNIREVGKAADSVTDFFMGMLIYEAILAHFEYTSEDMYWYEPEEITTIDNLLVKVPYHIYNWFSDRIDFYTYSGEEYLFIFQGENPSGMYSAKTLDSYKKMKELIGNLGEIC